MQTMWDHQSLRLTQKGAYDHYKMLFGFCLAYCFDVSSHQLWTKTNRIGNSICCKYISIHINPLSDNSKEHFLLTHDNIECVKHKKICKVH